MNKSKCVFLVAATFAAALTALGPGSSALAAPAVADCRIVFEKTDGSSLLAYVVNNNQAQTIQVTVSCTEDTFPHPQRRLPDQVHVLAPGQRAFCGGTVSNGSKYTYAVVGAQYR